MLHLVNIIYVLVAASSNFNSTTLLQSQTSQRRAQSNFYSERAHQLNRKQIIRSLGLHDMAWLLYLGHLESRVGLHRQGASWNPDSGRSNIRVRCFVVKFLKKSLADLMGGSWFCEETILRRKSTELDEKCQFMSVRFHVSKHSVESPCRLFLLGVLWSPKWKYRGIWLV